MRREKRLASQVSSIVLLRSRTLCLASSLSERLLRGPLKGRLQIVLRKFLASTDHPTGQMRKPLPRLPSLSTEFLSHLPIADFSHRFARSLVTIFAPELMMAGP